MRFLVRIKALTRQTRTWDPAVVFLIAVPVYTGAGMSIPATRECLITVLDTLWSLI